MIVSIKFGRIFFFFRKSKIYFRRWRSLLFKIFIKIIPIKHVDVPWSRILSLQDIRKGSCYPQPQGILCGPKKALSLVTRNTIHCSQAGHRAINRHSVKPNQRA